MELYLNKKNDGISVDIDFDELIDQYGQQLIEAIAKRKKALEEISGLPDKDFPPCYKGSKNSGFKREYAEVSSA